MEKKLTLTAVAPPALIVVLALTVPPTQTVPVESARIKHVRLRLVLMEYRTELKQISTVVAHALAVLSAKTAHLDPTAQVVSA